jgi:hypothetical protein
MPEIVSRLAYMAAAGLASALLTAQPAAVEPLVLMGARVLDVVGGRYLSAAAVVVEGDHIAAIYPKMPAPLPAASRQIDLAGTTLVPGLGDMHAYAAPDPDADADYFFALGLAHGVTMYRTLNVRLPWAVGERRRVEAGDVLAPRLWTSGPRVEFGPPSGPWVVTVADAAGARRQAETQARAGVDWIAVSGAVPADIYRVIVSSAHAAHVRVEGESGAASMVQLAALRVDSIDGLAFLSRSRDEYVQQLAARPDLPKDAPAADLSAFVWEQMTPADAKKAVAQLVRARAVLVPMLAASMPRLEPERVEKDPSLALLPGGRREKLLAAVAEAVKTLPEQRRERAWQARLTFVADFVRAGGGVSTGTGFEENGYPPPGAGVHAELARLVEAGLTPAQAIRAATITCASLVGASGAGQIRAGYRADLIAVEGDPLQHIEDLQRIRLIVRGGEVLDRNELLTQARRAILERSGK